jgi:hypothetical protein
MVSGYKIIDRHCEKTTHPEFTMVLKLYGTPSSAFVQKVLIALLETNSTYELVAVDTIPGGSKGPTYLAKNPFGTIPCIVSPRRSHRPAV